MKKFFLFTLVTLVACCAFALGIGAQEHNLEEEYVFPNGFLEKGTYSCTCKDQDCQYTVTKETAPLFEVCGFSVPLESADFRGINFGYQANLHNLEEYERINGSDLKYGFLISLAENYNNENAVISRVFDRDNYAVDVKLNYGEADSSGIFNNTDVIFAGAIEEIKDGEAVTTYFQSNDGGERKYQSQKYGELCAVNYNYVSGEYKNSLHFVDACSMVDSAGTLSKFYSNGRAACSSYIRINEGDIISLPEDSDFIFLCYAYYYDYEINEYVYTSYIDLDPKTSSNWNRYFEFKAGQKDSKGSVLDYDNLYVRLIFKTADMQNTPFSKDDVKEEIKFNLSSVGFDTVDVTYEYDGITRVVKARKGEMISSLLHPEKEGHYFAGWYAKDDTEFTNQITEETVIEENVTLVAKWTMASYTWESDIQIHDGRGNLEYTNAGRITISDYIKVKAGDSITIDRNGGYKFIIYCYTGEEHSYESNSYIDCDSYQTNSDMENWGHTYTFGDTITLGNGNTINTDDVYIRIVFSANAGKQITPITIEGVMGAVRLNFSNQENSSEDFSN